MEWIAVAVAVVVVVVVAIAVARRRGDAEELPDDTEGDERKLSTEASKKAESEEVEGSADAEEAAAEEPTEAQTEAASGEDEKPAPAEDEREGKTEAEPEGTAERAAAQAEPAPATGEPSEQEVAQLKKGLASTRGGFISRLAKLFGKKEEIDPALLDEIEEVLVTADIGVGTTQKILGRLRERMDNDELREPDAVWKALREEARAILATSKGPVATGNKPTVVLVVGVNGTGKTTTIGKLASRLVSEDKKVILAAGDTFRAAAVLQLEVWGRKVGCEVVKGKERADPGSVVFDAIKKAEEQDADVVIADTAGRLHTKTPLMEELKKVGRTAEKALGRPADEVLLVLDSTTGQNAIQQAQMFKEALPLTGIVLTKLDGTAKGGVILGIVDEHQLSVRYIGIGERVEDLREFDSASFVEALFTKPDDETMAA